MPGSTLIFLLIIAIWAAYLMQSWARHRQHAVTARNVDKFSTAMRVLQRRAPLPQAEAEPASIAPPALPATPEVTVKRAPRTPSGASPLVPAGSSAGQLPGRRWRAGFLLASLAGVTVLTPLSVLGLVSWIAPVVAGGLLLLVLGWGVVAAQRARRARLREWLARDAARRAEEAEEHLEEAEPARRSARPGVDLRSADRPVVAMTVVPQAEPEAERRSAAEVAAVAAAREAAQARRAAREFFDVEAMASPAAEPLPSVTETEVAPATTPGEWQPVPVPKPTYSMKGKAVRPEVPVEQIPFDGRAMALDVEDEELPAVFSAV